jgi:hypothetical protein
MEIKSNNGPENNGLQTQCLNRRVTFNNDQGISIELVYCPRYHSND